MKTLYISSICPQHKLSLVALLVLAAMSSGARSAPVTPPDGNSRRTTVSLAGLDLSTPAGLQQAQYRVHQTARRLCSQVSDIDDLSHHENYVACVEGSLDTAMQQIKQNDEPPQYDH